MQKHHPKKNPEYVDMYSGEITYVKTATSMRDYASEGITFVNDKGLTEQSHEAETNLNNIIARFMKTQDMSLLNKSQGMYIDLDQHPASYQEALNLVLNIAQKFDTLPAVVRAHYDNDPAKFAADVKKDPEGVYKRAEALLVSELPKAPSEAPVASPSPAPAVVQPVEDKK